ncbi:PREDICTED: uncharacterized protein At1g15400-like [Lupinus angustifolius]|nr:PREDICTED: uncharacterized protein At1g15400-like [Lupinus angustifolius]
METMSGLQRSAVSFRRQGSSGFVWDDKFLTEEFNKVNQQNEEQQHEQGEIKAHATTSLGSVNTTMERSRSTGGGSRGYRTGKVSPAIDPPSPKLSACGFCSAFGKHGDKGSQRSRPGKRRTR